MAKTKRQPPKTRNRQFSTPFAGREPIHIKASQEAIDEIRRRADAAGETMTAYMLRRSLTDESEYRQVLEEAGDGATQLSLKIARALGRIERDNDAEGG